MKSEYRYAGAFGYLVEAIRGIAETTVGARRRELLAAIERAEAYLEHGPNVGADREAKREEESGHAGD